MTRLAPIQVDIPIWNVPQFKNSRYAAIPWEAHIKIHKNYDDSQTAEEIARRGGFGIKEAAEYYKINPIVVWLSKGGEYPKNDEGWIKVEFAFEDEEIYFKILNDKEIQIRKKDEKE